jgi:sugar lactone lactonase YvrE
VTIDAAGNVYIGGYGSASVQVFSEDGAFLTSWGTFGPGEGQLTSTDGPVLDGYGNIYIIDNLTGRLVKFRLLPPLAITNDASENPIASPIAESTEPVEFQWQVTGLSLFYVGVAPDGTVWTNDIGFGDFKLFDADGHYLETWKPGGEPAVPADAGLLIAFGPDGSIYVTEGVYVRKYDRDRMFVTAWGGTGSGDGQFRNATGLSVDAAGNVYVCDEIRSDVQKFDADGRFLAKWGGPGSDAGEFLAPVGFMGVDSEGNIYIADHGNHRVQKFAPDGTFLLAFGGDDDTHGQLSDPNSVAIDAVGNVYVGVYGSGRVQVFAADGTFLVGWGEFGTGEGSLTSGDTVALDGLGTIYIADNLSGRLVKFKLLSPLAVTGAATPVAAS